ncbi:uncharacterized protein SPPG_01161 [Spizellomyces punctatus DAOM BR117]|uniref:Uncharacterized protein n=1 Tax=Spizellomyces punctatus (strain DAOM BR117) TaxID=645134 RepID=A0A0L0HS21_SPIPD|nr:uncharacterized protein SPPG_01161 [Spizellomyces punctatus DAOM BR117]KND03695.1 hypothetical protein SPPG_01161 [Spizellomyces punctatus DAOM BR117]|eukprot:XP_016611734.1 hypothetical protein SPPG_01161 [Spizellomyces punctatus DAOM BR117]
MAEVATRLGLPTNVHSDLEDGPATVLEVRATRSRLAHHPALPPIHKRSHSCDGAVSNRPQSAASDSKASDVALIADTPHEDHGAQLLVSLRVCKECQNALLGAFEHCLAKNGDQPIMGSLHEIDEVEDGRRLTEPPYFRIVKDPTKPKNTVYTDVSEKIDRERWAYVEQRYAATQEHPGNARATFTSMGPRGWGIESGRVFSGALYKRTLDAKDKEIHMLREQLYERTQSEKQEQNDVEKLRIALKKAVNYYVYAEEWQAVESARLQQDIRYLKAELSSLMAFLINSEEGKRKLSVEIENLRQELKNKDQKIAETEKLVFETKSKLHESFKEFLQMNETMARLRKEAEKGSEVTQGRNEILQRNLDKLARDYETTSKDLTLAQNRIRELEFELGELVTQFNLTGEGKRTSEEQNVKLTAELDKTAAELKRTQHAHDISSMQNRQLEEELREMNRIHTDTKYDLDVKITNLTKDLEAVKEQKKDLDVTVKQLKNDNEKLTNALKGVTRAKDQLESAFRVATQKHEKEIQGREARIQELGNLRAEDAKDIKKLQEQKEQLMFQVTDLQNSLDRETANVNMVNFEIAQVRRQAEEKTGLLEEQIEKLNLAKNNLANDKRQVTEKFKLTRSELQQREQELAEIKVEFAQHREQATSVETQLRKELAEIRSVHQTLEKEHTDLEERYVAITSTKADLESKQSDIQKRQGEMEARERHTQAAMEVIKVENERVTAELQQVTTEKKDIGAHLESVLVKVDELSRTISNLEREHRTTVKEKDSQIAKLSKDSYDAHEEVARLDKLTKKLKRLVDKLEVELTDTKQTLSKETGQREHLETTLHDIRQSLHSERKVRLEFERMHAKLDRREAEREMERLGALRMRDRLLAEVAKGLQSEYGRLKEISTMLPGEADLVTIDAPEVKDFKPAELPSPAVQRSLAAKAPGFKLVVRAPATVAEEEENIQSPRTAHSVRVY